MSRLPLVDPAQASGRAQDLLSQVERKLGSVPNMFRAFANSPAALSAYLSFGESLGKSSLSAKVREQIALVVGELNACGYCLSAHSAIGSSLGLGANDIEAARQGEASDPKAQAALELARTILLERGHVRDADLAAARDAGLDDAAIIEVLATVVVNIFTNWFNHIAETPIDFPEVTPGVARHAGSAS